MLIIRLGHIPQISTTAIVDRFKEEANERDLEDPAKDTAPCHAPSAYRSKDI